MKGEAIPALGKQEPLIPVLFHSCIGVDAHWEYNGMGMRVLDLFSGIGGFSLGLERVGMETVAFCEIEPFCRRILQKHWPDAIIHEDIRKIDGRQYQGAVELVCGGFPCQPFSHAGEQRGKQDDRHLWPEMLRVIREVQPAWVLGENVPGIISMELDQCLADLEEAGYSAGAFVIPACAADAHHIRNRVWICAHANGPALRNGAEWATQGRHNVQGSRDAQLGHDGTSQPMADPHPERQLQSQGVEQEQRGWAGNSSEDVANTERSEVRSRSEEVDSRETQATQRSGERSRPVANPGGKRLEGWQSGGDWGSQHPEPEQSGGPVAQHWEPEPDVGRVANGVPHRVDRLKGLGNAVVPQVVERLGRMILDIEEEMHGTSSATL